MKILLVCAVKEELHGYDLPAGVDVLVCGVGPVESAIRLTQALARKSYALVINIGIAGGFDRPDGPVTVGTSVVVTHEYYADLRREDGSEPALPGGAKLTDHITLHRHAGDPNAVLEDDCDDELVALNESEASNENIPQTPTNRRLRSYMSRFRSTISPSLARWGPAVCSATITTSDERAEKLLARYPDALVEAMEGFGLSFAAQAFEVPFLELRGVSNRVGDREKSGWNFAAGIQASHTLLDTALAACDFSE